MPSVCCVPFIFTQTSIASYQVHGYFPLSHKFMFMFNCVRPRCMWMYCMYWLSIYQANKSKDITVFLPLRSTLLRPKSVLNNTKRRKPPQPLYPIWFYFVFDVLVNALQWYIYMYTRLDFHRHAFIFIDTATTQSISAFRLSGLCNTYILYICLSFTVFICMRSGWKRWIRCVRDAHSCRESGFFFGYIMCTYVWNRIIHFAALGVWMSVSFLQRTRFQIYII